MEGRSSPTAVGTIAPREGADFGQPIIGRYSLVNHPDGPDFADLLRRHIERTGIPKAALARAIGTRPQYIREIETGRKPPPTLDKVECLADSLDLGPADRELFLARAREGRTKPESRDYLRNLETAFTTLMDMFGVDCEARERIRQGEFDETLEAIRDAFVGAGRVRERDDIVSQLQIMRYRAFLGRLCDNLDTLGEEHSGEDLKWVQEELLRQMERLVGLRRSESELSRRLGTRE